MTIRSRSARPTTRVEAAAPGAGTGAPAGALLGSWGGTGATGLLGRAPRAARMQQEDRELRLMLGVGFVLLLVPATLARLSGWRWQPWPPGPHGYRSIVAEARSAADTHIPFGFMGW